MDGEGLRRRQLSDSQVDRLVAAAMHLESANDPPILVKLEVVSRRVPCPFPHSFGRRTPRLNAQELLVTELVNAMGSRARATGAARKVLEALERPVGALLQMLRQQAENAVDRYLFRLSDKDPR